MPTMIRQEMLMCGYKRCCPTVQIFDDGSLVLSDDDTETGSVGTIKVAPESVARLITLLKAHTKK